MEAKKYQHLLSAGWRSGKAYGVIQCESKILRTGRISVRKLEGQIMKGLI